MTLQNALFYKQENYIASMKKKICPNSYKPADFFFTDKNSSCNLRNFFPCILNQITLSGLFPNYEISKSLRYK